MANAGLIQADAVGMTFAEGRVALRQVTLRQMRGEFVSIVGPSGCGKSTLLRLIAGLDSPTSGTISVAECHPYQARQQSVRLAFVFQDPNLLPWRTVTDNIRLPLQLQGTDRRKQRELVQQKIRLIGLTDDDSRKRPRMLSGGMRMRVSLARALVTSPDVLLMDEPFGALDDIMRQQLNEELMRIWSDQRWTAVFVTHNVAEAVFLSQRILVMSSSPGTITADVTIPFAYPRKPQLRSQAEFARLTGEISSLLKKGAEPQV